MRGSSWLCVTDFVGRSDSRQLRKSRTHLSLPSKTKEGCPPAHDGASQSLGRTSAGHGGADGLRRGPSAGETRLPEQYQCCRSHAHSVTLCCLHPLRFQVDNLSLSEEQVVRQVDGDGLQTFDALVSSWVKFVSSRYFVSKMGFY